MTDYVVLAALALAAFIGWRRGTLRMALPVLGVVAGYAGAFFLYRPLGRIVGQATGLPAMLAYPAGGLVAFVLVTLLSKLPALGLERRLAPQRGKHAPALTGADRAGGAILGVAVASAVTVVVLWALAALGSASGQGPDLERSRAGRIAVRTSRRFAQAAAQRATGERLLSSTMALLATEPRAGAHAIQTLAGDVRLTALFGNTDLHAALLSRNPGALARHPTMDVLARDPEFLGAVETLGLVRPGEGRYAIAAAMVADVAPLVRAVDELRRDPEVRKTLEGPNGLGLRLQRGDAASLLRDRDFNVLAGRVLETLRRQSGQPR